MPDLDFDPLNREPELQELISSFITQKNGYDRNHGKIPHLSASTHLVQVDGAVEHTLSLSVAQLQHDFPQHTVVCALQCAGNRRHTMRTKLKEVQGLDWGDAAVMNCKWRGPRLLDILHKAKITLPASEQRTAHVAFASYAVPVQEDDWYGGSIALSRAMDDTADVILALEMNNEPLTPEHGFPVRVVTPGIAGARAVKWLDRISVQVTESDNFYQTHDYKILPPEAVDSESAAGFWDTTPALQIMPVNSVIAIPQSGTTIARARNGTIEVKGYALPSGEGGPVVKVEVSGDGEDWVEAELVNHEDDSRWSWKLWRADVKVEAGRNRTIFSKATDSAGNTQEKRSQWNLRGVGYNGYGEVNELDIQ